MQESPLKKLVTNEVKDYAKVLQEAFWNVLITMLNINGKEQLYVPSIAGILANKSPEIAYVLQADAKFKPKSRAVQTLRDCQRDWIILDATYDGSSRWTKNDLAAIRGGKTARKIVCYLSIGEAETYRSYWRKNWDANKDGKPDSSAPKWLNVENPDWEGNYKVR